MPGLFFRLEKIVQQVVEWLLLFGGGLVCCRRRGIGIGRRVAAEQSSQPLQEVAACTSRAIGVGGSSTKSAKALNDVPGSATDVQAAQTGRGQFHQNQWLHVVLWFSYRPDFGKEIG